jgi:transcriptional regulator with XRE-family HTH domain
MQFAQILTYYRERAVLEKSELASKLGVKNEYIYGLEKGRFNPPTPDRCEQLAVILGLNDSEKKKFFELAYEGRLKDKDLLFQEAIGRPTKVIVKGKEVGSLDETTLKKQYISDLNQWAQKHSIEKVKALIDFLKMNGE